MSNYKLPYLVGIFCLYLLLVLPCPAGAFGISPPHVVNDRLFPGAHYEQQITLSRTDEEKGVKCKVEYDIPGFEKWITLDPGNEFVIPAGERVAKLVVKVDVPKDAKPGRITGNLRITAAPLEPVVGKINIVLGAQVAIDLVVTSEKFSEMSVLQVKINDIEPGWKVKVDMKVANKGNQPITPDRVVIDVYDSSFKNLILSAHQDRLAKVKAFETKEVSAYFDQKKLEVGQYWGDVKVYRNGEVAWEEKAIFTVQPKGTLPPQPKEPAFDLDTMPLWISYSVVSAGVLILLAVIFITITTM